MSVDIRIKHNEDWVLDFQLMDENNNPVADLVGATAKLQIRDKALSSSPLFDITGVITPADGTVQFTVTDTQISSLLNDGDMRRSLVYGTKITYADGIDEEPVAGRLKIFRGVVI